MVGKVYASDIKVDGKVQHLETMSDSLSDVLCWWHGFVTGVMINADGDTLPATLHAPNDAMNDLRELNLAIKTTINQMTRDNGKTT